MLIISIVAGITVNPIAIGTKPIDNTTLSEEIKKINETDINKLWIADSNFTGQYLIANGANCLNGVNVYPNFKWLNIVDPEKKYNEVYNRYAHIHVKLGDNTNFELTSPDAYTVTLTYDNVKNLNIKYYLTLTELSEEDIANFNLSSVYSNETYNQYIYEFNY